MAGAGAALPFVDVAAAQEADFVEILGTDPSDYPAVDLSVRVDTETGRSGELGEEDFRVFEDGDRRPITSFEFTSSSLDLVFVFDDSGSMGNEIGAMQRQTNQLVSDIDGAGMDARYALTSFRDDVDQDLPFTEDAEQLQDAVDALSASAGGDLPEANFDAIEAALDYDFRDGAQKVLVDITDALAHYRGDGSGISDYTLEEVADDLHETGVSYIAVSPGFEDPDAAKAVLADEVDGLWIDIGDADFDAILRSITRTVIETYILGYDSATPPGRTAPVGATVTDPERGEASATSEVHVPSDAVSRDAVAVDQTLPPTAVETDERATFEVTLDSLAVEPETLSDYPDVDLVWRDKPLGGVTPSLEELTVADDGTAEYTFTLPSAESVMSDLGDAADDITAAGLQYDVDLAPDGGTSVAAAPDVTSQTDVYAFETVDTVGVAPVLPSDVESGDYDSPDRHGQDLFDYLRKKAEFVNEYYAGGLGSMGAHGFDFEVIPDARDPTSANPEALEDGWIRLDGERDDYDDGRQEGTFPLTADAGQAVVDLFGVEFGRTGPEYDTLFTVMPERYTRPFYRGSLAPDALDATTITIPVPVTTLTGPTTIEVPVAALTDLLPISPVNTTAGRTDAIYCQVDGTAWRHELGHSLGPNNQVGFPDLYYAEGDNLGFVHNWGLMGLEGDTISSYSRVLGGDMFTSDGWLEPDHHTHFLDATVSPTPLTEKRLGDGAEFVDSTYMDWWIDLDSFGESANPLMRIDPYYVEARKNYDSSVVHPDADEDDDYTGDGIPASPASHDGVAIYRYGGWGLELAPDDTTDEDLDYDDDLLMRILPTINYHGNPAGTEDDPTLTDQGSSALETYHDPESAATFEIVEGFDDGPRVDISRDATEHLPEWTQKGLVIAAEIVDAGFAFGERAWEAITAGIDDAGDLFWELVDEGEDVLTGIVERGESVIVDAYDGGKSIAIRGLEHGEDVVFDGIDAADDVVIDGVDVGTDLVTDAVGSGETLVVEGADTGTDVAVDVVEDGGEVVVDGLDEGEDVVRDVGSGTRRAAEDTADGVSDEITDTADDAGDCVSSGLDCVLSSDIAMPGLDVVVETEDGRRAGFDPETGEELTEIEDAYGVRQGGRTFVVVPGVEPVDVTISAERLADAVADEETPPGTVSYERTVIVDDDPYIEDVEGVPLIDGRVRQTKTEDVRLNDDATDASSTGLVPADVSVEPDRLNARSNGNFVTAWLGFPDDIDPAQLRLETVMVGLVGAVTDEQYGFTESPPVEQRSDGERVMVKFPRGELVDELEPGKNEVTVTGAVEDASFRATTELEVFVPGNGGGNGNASNGGGN